MARPSDPARAKDPDAESARPRLAVLGVDLGARELWSDLGDDPGLAKVDLVLVCAGDAAGLRAFGEGFTRRSGPGGAFLAGGLEEACALARSRGVDAIAGALSPDEATVLAGLEPGAPLVEVLVRGERRVLFLSRRDPDELHALLVAAAKGLARDLGVARPRLALCATEGADMEPAASRARASGLDVIGPLAAEDAFGGRADLVCTSTRDQTRLGLALAGRDATARVLLGLPFVRTSEDPAEKTARPATLRASVLLAARLARARGDLVSSREEREAEKKRARLAAVAVSARSAREDRCPYCRRDFSDDEPGLRCARCETPHHRACIHEHGRCTVHGCPGTSVLRAGAEIPVSRLGGEGTARVPFVARLGSDDEGTLLMESPVDDPTTHPRRRELTFELESAEIGRGGRVAGALVVQAPRAFKASGGTFRLRATLEVQPRDERARIQPIVEREAVVMGDPSRGLLGRLSDGVASLLGTGEYLSIPAGTRRYHFSFRLRDDHPATVHHRSKNDRETVTTTLEASLSAASGGTLSALLPLVVR